MNEPKMVLAGMNHNNVLTDKFAPETGQVLIVGNDRDSIRGQANIGAILDDAGFDVVQETAEPEQKIALVDDFVFGSNKRGENESFDDYKWRQKNEKLQLKVLNKLGRHHWPGSKGTLRNQVK